MIAACIFCTPQPAGAAGADPRAATIEALALLQVLLRQDTANPPGNEVRAARVLAVFFSEKGIGCELIEPRPGRGSLLCTVQGNGARPPLLVVTHLDVAAAVRGSAGSPPGTVPVGTTAGAAGAPASPAGAPAAPRGTPSQGRVCGRGVRGGKGISAALAEGIALLAAQKTIARDVLFLAAADGEGSGDWGPKPILDSRPELRRIETALVSGVRTAGETAEGALLGIDLDARVTDPGGPPLPCASPTEASLIEAICRASAVLTPPVRVEAAPDPSPAALLLLRQGTAPAWGVSFVPTGEDQGDARSDDECLPLESFDRAVQLLTGWLLRAAAE
jgi:acetylornithine deacetylase/succinyl-diaminopimelate desuccinylase-like protein